MVVHQENALVAHTAVVGSEWFDKFAFLAEKFFVRQHTFDCLLICFPHGTVAAEFGYILAVIHPKIFRPR